MKRALLALAACGTPQPEPIASHVAGPPPCPEHVERGLKMTKVDACVYGHFPREGWVVFATNATGQLTQAIVARDGTIAYQDSMQVGAFTATLTALDLDGDGTDEILEDVHFRSSTYSIESLVVYGVRGDKLVELGTEPISFHDSDDAQRGCSGKLVISNRTLAIDTTDLPSVPMDIGDGGGPACLFDGHHVIVLDHDVPALR